MIETITANLIAEFYKEISHLSQARIQAILYHNHTTTLKDFIESSLTPYYQEGYTLPCDFFQRIWLQVDNSTLTVLLRDRIPQDEYIYNQFCKEK